MPCKLFFLCHGGLSYVPYRSLSISKLDGGGGGVDPHLLPSPFPNLTYTAAAKLMHANSQQTVQNTEYRIQNTEFIIQKRGDIYSRIKIIMSRTKLTTVTLIFKISKSCKTFEREGNINLSFIVLSKKVCFVKCWIYTFVTISWFFPIF